MATVSVIMGVKNGEKTLPTCIESIIHQTFEDWEFIICDDGSTDNTLKVLSEYASKDSRIKYLHQDTCKGVAYALNMCIDASTGEYVAIHDSDDYSHPQRLEKQLHFIKQHPEYAIVGTSWYNVMGDKCIPVNAIPSPTAKDQIKGGLFMHPSLIINKKVLIEAGKYTASELTRRSQDYHMVMKVLSLGYKMFNMPEHLFYYNVDDGTINRSINWKRVKGLMWIRYDAYRRNKLPLWAYIYVLKPLFSNLLPKGFMKRYYRSVYKNQ